MLLREWWRAARSSSPHRAGRPTTDARAALAGAVLPFGGPKGSAISFIIDILSGVLTGASFALHLNTLEDLKTEQNLGQVFAAVRTDLFLPAEEFARRVDEIDRKSKRLNSSHRV